jgi:hypothetical protein
VQIAPPPQRSAPQPIGTPVIDAVEGRLAVAGVVAASVLAFLAAVYGLVRVINEMGWNALVVVPLCCAPLVTAWSTGWLLRTRRTRAAVPPWLLERRYHGTLDSVADREQRPLRPIGTTAAEVAARTELLLAELVANPSVRIFRGVRATGVDAAPTTHAIAAGRSLILLESVAWPPGRYQAGWDGRLYCDDVYIGQTVAPLLAAVRHWRRTLPRWHRVSAMVVVHATEPELGPRCAARPGATGPGTAATGGGPHGAVAAGPAPNPAAAPTLSSAPNPAPNPAFDPAFDPASDPTTGPALRPAASPDPGSAGLPCSVLADLVWTPAEAALSEIRRRIPARPGISRSTLASLLAAAPTERTF